MAGLTRYIAIVLCLLSLQAMAQGVAGRLNFGETCPGGGAICYKIPQGPTRFFNFLTGTLPNGFAFSRASTANYFDSSGVLQSAAINIPRFDYGFPGNTSLQGLLIEPAATNLLLWSRDLTNSVWTQVTATVLLDQTGIDNVSNSASSFLAIGANSTVCQTVTQAATNATSSVYLKRLSGVGNVAISQDGGASYTTITISSSWKRFQHAPQSTLNPGFCIRLATTSDQIAVDYVQLENVLGCGGGCNYVTSPIGTTTVQVSRSGDGLSMPVVSPTGATDSTGQWMNLNSGAFVGEWELPYGNFTTNSSSYGVNGALISFNGSNIGVPANGTNCNHADAQPANTVWKTGATYGRTYFRSSCIGSSLGIGNANPSSIGSFTFMAPAYARKFTYWNYPLTTAQLVAQTQ